MNSTALISLTAATVGMAALAVPAQDAPDPSSLTKDEAAAASGPCFAPLPANCGQGQDWQSLSDDPRLAPSPAEPAPGPRLPLDSSGNDPSFSRRNSAFSRSVVDPRAMLEQQLEEMRQFQSQMRQRFNQQMPLQMGPGTQFYGFSSQCGDLVDAGDCYEIEVTISGLQQGSVDLDVQGNSLVMRCDQCQSSTQTDPSGAATSAFSYTNRIQQSWTLPADADRAGISADMEEDRLLITIPRLESEQANFSVPID